MEHLGKTSPFRGPDAEILLGSIIEVSPFMKSVQKKTR